MTLALIILQYFLFSLFLFCLRVAVLVYRYRLPIIKHEFEFSQTTKLLIWAIRRVVLPCTFLGIIIYLTVILFLRKETKEYFPISSR